ncbi:MAG: hypothetical protein ACYCS4_12985, partial [Acidimicrobiales bacterium]
VVAVLVGISRTLRALRGKPAWHEAPTGCRLLVLEAPQSLTELALNITGQTTGAMALFTKNAGRRLVPHAHFAKVLRRPDDEVPKGAVIAVPESYYAERDELARRLVEMAEAIANAAGVEHTGRDWHDWGDVVDAEDAGEELGFKDHAELSAGPVSPFSEVLRDMARNTTEAQVSSPLAVETALANTTIRSLRAAMALGWTGLPELTAPSDPLATPMSAEIASFDAGLVYRHSSELAWCLAHALRVLDAKNMLTSEDVPLMLLGENWGVVVTAGAHHIRDLGTTGLGFSQIDKDARAGGITTSGGVAKLISAAREFAKQKPTTKLWLFAPSASTIDATTFKQAWKQRNVADAAFVPVGWLDESMAVSVVVNLAYVGALGFHGTGAQFAYDTAVAAISAAKTPWPVPMEKGPRFAMCTIDGKTLSIGVGKPASGWSVEDGVLQSMGLRLIDHTPPAAVYVLGRPRVVMPEEVLLTNNALLRTIAFLAIAGPTHTDEIAKALGLTIKMVRKTTLRRRFASEALITSNGERNAIRSLNRERCVSDLQEFRGRMAQGDVVGAFLLLRGRLFPDEASPVNGVLAQAINQVRNELWNTTHKIAWYSPMSVPDAEVAAFVLRRFLAVDPENITAWNRLVTLHVERHWDLVSIVDLLEHLGAGGMDPSVLADVRLLVEEAGSKQLA